MAKRTRTSSQPDLVLFGLRWLIPLAVLVDGALKAAPGEPVILSDPAWVLIIGTSIYNLGVLLALNSNLSLQTLTAITVAFDTLISVGAVVLLGPSLIWAGLLPASRGLIFGKMIG